jgi:hypothetical protein
MSGNEFFYIDADGKKQDAALHDAILNDGDHHAATEVSREIADIRRINCPPPTPRRAPAAGGVRRI